MKARTLLVIFAAVLVAVVAVPAKAGCSPSHAFYGYDNSTGAVSYIHFPADTNLTFDPNPAAPTGGLIGRLWQTGARNLANEGGAACLLSTWVSTPEQTGLPDYYINGYLTGVGPDLGLCDAVGCATGSMIVVIQATSTDGKNAYVVTSKAIEDPAAFAYYTYVNANLQWPVVAFPKPYVAGSTKVGTTVNVAMGVRQADVSPTYQGTTAYPDLSGVITGMNLYKVRASTPPPRNRSAWGTAVRTVAYTGGDVALPLDAADCSNQLQDNFYAFSLVFDNGQFESDYVSAAAQVNCNSALAEPGKFKKVDKKPKGKK